MPALPRFTVPFVLASCLVGLTTTAKADDPAADRKAIALLSSTCYKCHGPDEVARKGGLRLDIREEAFEAADSGGLAIVPGDPTKSSLVARIFSENPKKRMPPPESNRVLSDLEKNALQEWVARGANYPSHWSFKAPQRSPLPKVRDAAWPKTPIDTFVLAKLEAEGLKPSPEADKPTLIRRLAFDLTGLPPTLAEVNAFFADKEPGNYERLVDRYLTSPHHGERLALDWLDAARYADTHGYHIDSGRDMTLWREWVINAFNQNLPFDQFTIEQLAGDLLPNATTSQKIASGFNRNHMITFEGGAIPEEYLNNYVIDRVNTTGTVWLGLTLACTQCHDHKYDPITQKDYYSLYAFFNNVPEKGLDGFKGNAVPMIQAPTAEQSAEIQKLKKTIETTEAAKVEELKKQLAALESKVPTAMVMDERADRKDSFILIRGQYDKHGEKVEPNVPAFLPTLPNGAPKNRLGLAKWLTDPAHPLVGRVSVNRFWQMFFGTGLVKTSEDFGLQGESPSHPELLDWLASEFTTPESPDVKAWDVRRLIKLIVTSATYRQSSAVAPALVAKDPENRLLARGPRVRLQAEFLRDQALALSGLLNSEIGGKSVSPYQPPGLWEELMSRADGKNWTAQSYEQSHGKDIYRRTMYTFWKRTSPPPSLATFDAPDRETCTVRRARTNTPLQALVLMNDPTYVEASRKMAERILNEGGADTSARLAWAFKLATAREAKPSETAVLSQILDSEKTHYQAQKPAAEKLLSVGESPRDPKLDTAELAAWTTVASVILNLDEVLNKN